MISGIDGYMNYFLTTSVNLNIVVSFVEMDTNIFSPYSFYDSVVPGTTLFLDQFNPSSTHLKSFYFKNISTQKGTVEIKAHQLVGGVTDVYTSMTPAFILNPDETLFYSQESGYQILNQYGVVIRNEEITINSQNFSFLKVGTAPEAAGQFYSSLKDAGLPGLFTFGTPGLGGVAVTDKTKFVNFANSSNSLYLGNLNVASTVASNVGLYDFLFYNTGIVVTTTTAQTLNTVDLPARDSLGTINGNNTVWGLLVTTQTTNAGAITTITMSYTNQDGISGKTATMPSFPATAVAGTFVPFLLAAGDTGIKSVQTITLGTTLGGGAVSLACFNKIIGAPILVANVGAINSGKSKIYNDSCITFLTLASATTAATINGDFTIEEVV